MHRRRWLQNAASGLFVLTLLRRTKLFAQDPTEAEGEYRSPYELKFRHEVRELEVGFRERPWSSVEEESTVPANEWYSRRVRERWGAWGPPARQYPAAPELQRRSVAWMQDRVILSASRWLGVSYQHHHIPAWDPPADWPWIKVAFGRNARGVDCSNFSSFYYNFGLGVKLDTGIAQQAERRELRGPGGHGVLKIGRLEKKPYDELIKELRPADLLYIKNDAGKLAHVIMWLGEVGVSPDGTPLVIDSTGSGHKDSNGTKIPIGVHIRPFSKSSWYFHSFSHAHRIIENLAAVREGEVRESEEGGGDAEMPPRLDE